MSDHHLSAEHLEHYVVGALSDQDASEVERHVSACKACEARLMNEARLELAFTQVASVRKPAAERRTLARAMPAAVAGALAIAAAAALWLMPTSPATDTHAAAAPPPVTATYESGDASTATAQLDGDALIGMRD